MKRVWTLLWPWLTVGLAAAVLSLAVGCPVRRLFGLGCPLCGMSRALLRAATLDFAGAFRLHPLWPVLPLGLAGGIACANRRPGGGRALAVLLAALFLAVYAIRLWKQDPVVRPDFSAGMLSGILC